MHLQAAILHFHATLRLWPLRHLPVDIICQRLSGIGVSLTVILKPADRGWEFDKGFNKHLGLEALMFRRQ